MLRSWSVDFLHEIGNLLILQYEIWSFLSYSDRLHFSVRFQNTKKNETNCDFPKNFQGTTFSDTLHRARSFRSPLSVTDCRLRLHGWSARSSEQLSSVSSPVGSSTIRQRRLANSSNLLSNKSRVPRLLNVYLFKARSRDPTPQLLVFLLPEGTWGTYQSKVNSKSWSMAHVTATRSEWGKTKARALQIFQRLEDMMTMRLMMTKEASERVRSRNWAMKLQQLGLSW